ncbi:ethanolamine kinase 1 isoform X2 [Lycorma delicatula]|uniref:ethanolamine kinase 1 isoform X2 n=1 Tax=Lycorma delicatula TaxID=130591 RepID=UPI003F519519
MSLNTTVQQLDLLLSLTEEDLLQGAATIIKHIRPHWNSTDVSFKLFTDGITNKLVGCFNSAYSEDVVLVRVYGQNTDLLIDRKAETRNFKLLQDVGYAPQLYATFQNGLVYEFVPGEVLTVDTVRSLDVYPMVARMMARIHHIDCGNNVPRSPALWDKVNNFLGLIPSKYDYQELQIRFENGVHGGVAMLRKELALLQSELSSVGSPVVFCHNDLLLANVIHRPTSVTFIDYEYASYNYQAFDIGNHFDEFAGVTDTDFSRYPEREFQLKWLRVYLEEYRNTVSESTLDVELEVSDHDIETLYVQVNKFALAAHFMWGVWAFVQAHHSTIDFDFLEYGIIRIKEYFRRKDEFFALKLPS